MPDVKLVKDSNRYLVIVDGQMADEVYKERGRSNRYPYHGGIGRGKGSVRWCAGRIAGEDYATRQAAVDEVVKRYRRRTVNE